jgi:hypothetical protein
MESYIKRTTKWIKTEVFDCSHPDVLKIWFTGALSTSGIPTQMDLTLNIYFKNGERKEFTAKNAIHPTADEKLIIEAEEYLQSFNNS